MYMLICIGHVSCICNYTAVCFLFEGATNSSRMFCCCGWDCCCVNQHPRLSEFVSVFSISRRMSLQCILRVCRYKRSHHSRSARPVKSRRFKAHRDWTIAAYCARGCSTAAPAWLSFSLQGRVELCSVWVCEGGGGGGF